VTPAVLVAPRGLASTFLEGPDMPNDTRCTEVQTIDQAVVLARRLLLDSWESLNQAQRVCGILDHFVVFADNGYGLQTPEAVSAEVARAFVMAPSADGSTPSVSLMHLRRSALRLLFRSLRESGVAVGDPTLDLVLPPRSPLATRPLADDEVVLCRGHALWSLSDLRRAAAWALAEATCRSVEVAQIRISDVDLEGRRVWIHGGRTTDPRWGNLTEWGAGQLKRRMESLPAEPATRVVYGGSGDSGIGQVSASVAIADVLTRAGLAGEPDVRPASIAAWAGRRILAETRRIDVVARRLGMASLDRTARFIAFDWQVED
jgi:integrase